MNDERVLVDGATVRGITATSNGHLIAGEGPWPNFASLREDWPHDCIHEENIEHCPYGCGDDA